jgi:hypothetical protein
MCQQKASAAARKGSGSVAGARMRSLGGTDLCQRCLRLADGWAKQEAVADRVRCVTMGLLAHFGAERVLSSLHPLE